MMPERGTTKELEFFCMLVAYTDQLGTLQTLGQKITRNKPLIAYCESLRISYQNVLTGLTCRGCSTDTDGIEHLFSGVERIIPHGEVDPEVFTAETRAEASEWIRYGEERKILQH